MSDLFKSNAPSGPVECLGKKFPNDEARRDYFLAILREKLKDPEFRKIEGFPIGSDEDILELSDPPYYTACPNPFIVEFVEHYGKTYNSNVPYIKEPFAADVSEGKNDPIYNAHSYHTKVPHKAIMRYILHYTQPGDIVFDGFCGTGMTGVAARSCGDRIAVEQLGYRVDDKGVVHEPETTEGKTRWHAVSKLGARIPILNDLSPIASFISNNFNCPTNVADFSQRARDVHSKLINELGWMYQTLHDPSDTQIAETVNLISIENKPNFALTGNKTSVNYTVWSDVFACPECAAEIVFFDIALDHKAGGVKDLLSCPECDATFGKKGLQRAWASSIDSATGQPLRQAKQVPVLINYSLGRQRFEKRPDAADIALIKKIGAMQITNWHPSTRLPEGAETRRNDPIGITHIHHFYTHRNLICLSLLRAQFSGYLGNQLLFAFTSTHQFVNKLCRLNVSNYFSGKGGKVDKPLDGTLYAPSISLELNVIDKWGLRSDFERVFKQEPFVRLVGTGSANATSIPSNSADYLFFDPPFGGNLMYSELNCLWEAWIRVATNNTMEAVESKDQSKGINEYRYLMTKCFSEAFRILKPGRWMTVEFSNTQAAVWNAIQTALQEAGFVVANVSAIDKQKGSFKAVTTTTAVKQDLVISAYKPNGGLEDRFSKAGGNEDSVWDFVRTHLQYLPSVKVREGELEFIAERDPRIIFDRLVAWFVRHNYPVPISSHEFQAGLSQRFSDRDGMVFLPEQVSEYDKKRIQTAQAPQMELFIADERSAIDWLTDYLRKKPSTYQEIHPDFISQLGAGWKKHEEKPELSDLLAANFFCYDPKTKDANEVPSQIHSYLSTNFKDLRGLEKNDQRLKAKAADRWYVPDSSKAHELERIREKSLLKEFDSYKSHSGRKLKEFRLEAMRAGFKFCWGNRDYTTIIAVAKKIPEDVLQEDEKLLLWYDQALTRMEGES